MHKLLRFILKVRRFRKRWTQSVIWLSWRSSRLPWGELDSSFRTSGSCRMGPLPTLRETPDSGWRNPLVTGSSASRQTSRGLHIPQTWTIVTFFLWGYLKDRVYSESPATVLELKNSIIHHVDQLRNNVELQRRVIGEFQKRIRVCLNRQGRHIEHLLWCPYDSPTFSGVQCTVNCLLQSILPHFHKNLTDVKTCVFVFYFKCSHFCFVEKCLLFQNYHFFSTYFKSLAFPQFPRYGGKILTLPG